MKKLFLFIFLFFVSALNTLAITSSHEYLYEITGFQIDANSSGTYGTMSGWALVNAGMCTGKANSKNECWVRYNQPKLLDTSLGSGKGNSNGTTTKSTKCKAENTYQYSLTVYGYDEKDKVVKSEKIDKYTPDYNTDLTYSQCAKSGGKNWDKCTNAGSYASACYLNVGFKFNIPLDALIDAGTKKMKFELSILKNGNLLKKFFISVASDKVTNINSNDNVSFEVRNPFTNVEVTASKGHPWKSPKYSNSKEGSPIASGSKYRYLVCETSMDSAFHLTWYKVAINTKNKIYLNGSGYNTPATSCSGKDVITRWVPSAWTAPAPGEFYIEVKRENTPKEVSACTEKNTFQIPLTKEVNSCSGDASFSGNNLSSCTVNTYSYYTKKCYENNFKASLNINEVKNGVTSFSIPDGGGFTATAKLSTTFKCEYTFDIASFKADYDKVMYNLNLYKNGSPDWYLNYNIKTNLDTILKNYMDQTKSGTSWDSKYNFKKAKAVLKVGTSSTTLISKDTDLKRETMDLNNDNKKEANYCLIKKAESLNLNGTKYSLNTNLVCGEAWSLELSLPEVCLSMKDGSVISCNSDSKDQLVGGKKQYVEEGKNTDTIKLELTNLGYDGNWKINLKNCSYYASKKANITYRQIDVSDPFIKTYNQERQIGKNYLNNTYSFVNIIKSDIWQQNYQYKYTLNKTNIENIKKDTKEEGVNSYLGRNCYFRNDNKYVCDFTRNKVDTTSQFFTNISIN